MKKLGQQTVKLSVQPSVIGSAAVGGKKEGQGPLKHDFDFISVENGTITALKPGTATLTFTNAKRSQVLTVNVH